MKKWLLTYPSTLRLVGAAAAAWAVAVWAPAGWFVVVAAVIGVVGATAYLVAGKGGAATRTVVTVLLAVSAAAGVTAVSVQARVPEGRVSGVLTVVTDPATGTSGMVSAGAVGRSGAVTLISRTELPPAGTRMRVDVPSEREGPRAHAFVDDWEVVAEPGPAWRVRAALRQHLVESAGTAHAGARLLPGLVVGDTSSLDAVTEANMQAMSLTHVTAVSGSNISIVALGVLTVFSYVARSKLPGICVAVVVTAGYVFVVGPDPSVVRAAVMGLLGAVVLVRGVGRAGIALVCSAVIFVLVTRPELAVSAGFILSVAATTGLLVLGDPLTRLLTRRLRVPKSVAQLVAVPLVAQVGVLPVTVALGSAPSAWAVLANAVAAPAIPPATLLGLVVLVSQPFGPVGVVCAWVGSAFAWWITAVAAAAVTLPGAHATWVAGVMGVVLAVGITVACALAIMTRWKAVWAGVAVVLFVAAAGVPLMSFRVHGNWVVAVCDVGQGSATVLKTGPGAALVIDTGAQDAVVDRCLVSLGVGHVDLMLSHLDRDHSGAIAGMVGGRELGSFYVSPQDARGPKLGSLHVSAPPHVVKQGDAFEQGQLTWRVEWPADTRDPGGNETSLVVRAEVATTSGVVSILIPGDVGESQQERLGDIQDVDILIAPHHGSKDIDPEFFADVAPRVGAVSVGPNTYGHPTAQALRAFGTIPVLRTDRCGTLVLTDAGDFGSGRPGCRVRLPGTVVQ